MEDIILGLIRRGDVELEVSSSATAALETAPSSLLRHEGGIAREALESTHNNDLESRSHAIEEEGENERFIGSEVK